MQRVILCFVFLFHATQIAFATQRLVFVFLAQEYATVAIDKAIGVVGGVSAFDTYSMYLAYIVGQ